MAGGENKIEELYLESIFLRYFFNLQQTEMALAAAPLALTSPAERPQKALAARSVPAVLEAEGIMTQSKPLTPRPLAP